MVLPFSGLGFFLFRFLDLLIAGCLVFGCGFLRRHGE